MALKSGTPLSALKPQVCSCLGATAVKADQVWCEFTRVSQFLGHVLGAMFQSMLWASIICKGNQNRGGRYNLVTWDPSQEAKHKK